MQRNPQNTHENRANVLLIKFLKTRYPELVNDHTEKVLKKGLALGRKRDFDQWLGKLFTLFK